MCLHKECRHETVYVHHCKEKQIFIGENSFVSRRTLWELLMDVCFARRLTSAFIYIVTIEAKIKKISDNKKKKI